MNLEDLRKQIDAIDHEIVKLIAERTKVAEEIGQEKAASKKPVTDNQREGLVLARVRKYAAENDLNKEAIEEIYQHIISEAKNAQSATVAFQGELGAYSEAAAYKFFGPNITMKPFENLEGVFSEVESGKAHFGIAPIENSLEGNIARTYDLLMDSDVKVVGEIEIQISHCLIAHPEATLDSITKIYSHPQALGQSRAFLSHLDKELMPSYDTAGSVKLIKERGIKDGGAIASSRAADIYGMKVLAKGIQDNPNNYTRFLILSKQPVAPSGKDKTSIIFSVKHKPGALFHFLAELNNKKLNMTKIESRPTRDKPWEYNFYLDFEGHVEEEAVKNALNSLEQSALFVKILGSYPKTT